MDDADADAFYSDDVLCPGSEDGDLVASILARFGNSGQDDHQHLCAAVGAIAQTLKDEGLPLTPVAYFGATVSSLARFSRNPASSTDPVVTALLSFLATVLPRVPGPAVRSRWTEVAETLILVLRFESLPPSGLKAGLKCASYLLVVSDKTEWSNISPLYGLVLGFIKHLQPKIRKQCNSSLHDVLLSFQGSAVLALASEEIKTIFERSLLLAGGSSTVSASPVGPKGAMEILFILNSLKECLPLMATNHISTVLKYCKRLLELQQPIVTRNIIDVLHALCANPSVDVVPDLLLDLLCSIAISIDDQEKSADAMALEARLLHVGMKKVFDLNKQLFILKLPIIFNALGEILASEHEEAIFSSKEAINSLLSSCIDEGLIRQGVEQIKASNGGMRRSGPTTIEKICATMEGFLGYRYNAVWEMSFQVLSNAFRHIGVSSYYLMAGAVRGLAEMHKLSDEDFPHRKQLNECLGASVAAMGPEKFLSILSLDLDAEKISDTNAWLIPLLKQHVVGACLSFFSENILVMARCVQQKSHKLEMDGRILLARSAEGIFYSLWSLFPAFCNYPIDTPTGLRVLQKELCTALHQEPSLRGVICSGLQTLIQQNNLIPSEDLILSDDKLSIHDKIEENHYTKEAAEENMKAIQSCASDFLSVLSEIFLTSSKDGGCLQSTIHDFASISDKKVVKKFFSGTMRKLLKVTEQANKMKQSSNSDTMHIDNVPNGPSLSHLRALLMDLTVSFLPGLGDEEIKALYNTIKPSLQDKEGIIQKKAYKVLSVILKERSQFLSNNLDELLQLMIVALPSCQFSAKRYRLDCLYFLIVHVSKDLPEQKKRDAISSFLTEIILSLKEANKKTRNRAYDLLVKIGHACDDEEQDAKKEKLKQLFGMIAGGLAGETPHMISAAVKGLARLAYEFSDLTGLAYSLLPSSYLLLQRKNREIIKANLGLIKVLVAKSTPENLQVHLRGMVEGLLKWQDDTKNHFKAKVKLLLGMLVKKCGIHAVKEVMPEEHMKLLANIRKIKERKDRKANSVDDAESLGSKTSMSRHSRWNHTRIFSDIGDSDDDDDEEMGTSRTFTRRTKVSYADTRASLRSHRKRNAAKSLPEDSFDQLDDDPLDLLDMQKMRSSLHSTLNRKRKQAALEDAEFDADGRLIVHDENYRPKKERSSEEADRTSHADNRSISGRSVSSSSARVLKKHRKTADSGWAYTGNEYTTKKAGGDIKREGKLEPYAYWPFDRKLLNRRTERKAVARKGMSRVMNVAKKLEGKSASGALVATGLSMKKKKGKSNKKSR